MLARSTRYALGLAAGYGLVAAAYIVISGRLAADASHSVEELQRIETIKGILYVAVTMVAVGIGGYLAMRRMERDSEELLQRERALVTNQARIVAGLTAGSIAHDANNALTAVLGNLSLLAMDAPPQLRPLIDTMRDNLQRLAGLNRRLTSAQHVEGRPELVDLRRLVRECITGLRAHDHLLHCRVECRCEYPVDLETRPLLIHQCVGNLLLNAGEAAGRDGRIEVVVREEHGAAILEVHDDGPGVPAERRRTLFDALASTKEGGSGLGLFSVRACVNELGGTVEVGDSPLGGACFRLRLPHAQSLVPA